MTDSKSVDGTHDAKKINYSGTITSIKGAIKLLHKLEGTRFCKVPDQRSSNANFPFGTWFRGQTEAWDLTPKVFRPREDSVDLRSHYDETNLYLHSRLRLPAYHAQYQSRFDWLCLMQHYDLATRLLDWTESPLIALYFAVRGSRREKRCEPALLAVLNARRLNFRATEEYGVKHPDSPWVKLLAELAFCRTRERYDEAVKDLPASCQKVQSKLKLGYPLAVHPNRLNDRMSFQSSVFTLHGGKVYPKNDLTPKRNRLEPHVRLEDINTEGTGKILRYYEIPPGWAGEIERDLFRLGIHEGSLFPEVDRQARYLEALW